MRWWGNPIRWNTVSALQSAPPSVTPLLEPTSVARSWEAFAATFAKNHGHFRTFHRHKSKNLRLHDNWKHNQKNHSVRGEIFFFQSCFLDEKLHKFLKFSQVCITAPHGHSRPVSGPPISHRKLFFYTACFKLSSGNTACVGEVLPDGEIPSPQCAPLSATPFLSLFHWTG